MPSAAVELKNIETGLQRTATTDNEGAYSFLQVLPGDYRIEVKANGFRTAAVNGIKLLVNNPATVNIKLEVGQLTETVSVSAEAVTLNTVDASIGNAIANKPIVQLPLNARNIVGLLALQPGVVFVGEETTDYRNGAVNGGKSDQANVTLDGADVNDQMDRNAFTSVLRMTPDSVQEFRVTTLNANADQGRSSGAQVSLVTKGGTNDIHGSLYEYHRNTLTSANNFFGNMVGNPREKLIRNIYGASLGGPLIKNRLFVFGNWEGRRDAKDGAATRNVPSMDMRQGILHYQRADGSVATVTPSDIALNVHPSGVNQNALKVMQGYPTPNFFGVGDGLNLVGYRFTAPTPLRWNTYIARFDYILDKQSKNTLFVRGNLQNDNEGGLPQFPGLPANTLTLRNNKGWAMGLTTVLKPNLISNFRYGLTRQGWEQSGVSTVAGVSLRGLDDPFGMNGNPSAVRSFAAIIPVHTIGEDLNWVRGKHTIQFGGVIRLNQNRRTDYQNAFSTATANASWLVDSGAELSSPFKDLPSSQYTLFRYAMADVMGLVTQGNAQYNYKVDGTVLAQGQAVLRNFRNQEYELYVQDTWRVNRALTITAGLRYSLMPPVYEADGQQVSPNISISDWFNKRGELASQGLSQQGAGRISFIPIDQGGRDLYAFHKKNFAPRLALAYSPQSTDGIGRKLFGAPGQTVIRAGWGMYYDLFGSALMRSYDATAFGLSNALSNPAAVLTVATAPRYVSPTALPTSIFPAAPPAKFPAEYPDLFTIGRGLDDKIKPPYNLSMNFSIGRDFGHGWFIESSYVGRLSRRSLVRRDAAMPTDLKDPKSGQTYFQAASILARQVNAGVATANVAPVPFWENLFSKIATSTQTATQVAYNRYAANQYDWTYALYQLDTGSGYGNCGLASRPRCADTGAWTFYNPQFSYMSVFSSIAGGSYHGAQLNVRKRFSNGDSLDMNYTFSKSIDLRSHLERTASSSGVLWNPWQPGLMKGVSDYDNTHIFSMLGVYNLPFGRGRRYGSNMNRIADAFVGGWQLSGVWRWSSGFPISIFETGVWPTNWNNNNWALWNGKPVQTAHVENMASVDGKGGPGMFTDPKAALAAFDYELPGGIGTRNPIRGDGMFNIDSNVSKRFTMPYSEKHSLQFRWEAFNLTNTARFDVQGASLDISTSGTFGKYSNTITPARTMQFGLRYEF